MWKLKHYHTNKGININKSVAKARCRMYTKYANDRSVDRGVGCIYRTDNNILEWKEPQRRKEMVCIAGSVSGEASRNRALGKRGWIYKPVPYYRWKLEHLLSRVAAVIGVLNIPTHSNVKARIQYLCYKEYGYIFCNKKVYFIAFTNRAKHLSPLGKTYVCLFQIIVGTK